MALHVFPVNDEGLGQACMPLLSMILEIGTAKRSWKQVKAIKSGQ